MSGCYGASHDLEVIDSRWGGSPGVEFVIRWCRRCGGCVIDVDVDGRTQPGKKMPMRFPAIIPPPAPA